MITLVSVIVSAGCIADLDDALLASSEEAALIDDSEPSEGGDPIILHASCAQDPNAFTPYSGSGHPSGSAASYLWRGPTSTYPAGHEDFRGYGAALPVTVECSTNKGRRAHLDVTAGCLNAVAISPTYTRGQVVGSVFRALALGHAPGNPKPVKWTDQSVEYRFYYTAATDTVNLPGFKAFARYRSENDLYVASWRMDGVVQIQKKHCGNYTRLALHKGFGKPAPNTWNTLRFDVKGNRLDLYLNRKLVLSTTDNTFSWGTTGIRIDSMSGAYIDNWKVGAP
jgi:hypothetical protein